MRIALVSHCSDMSHPQWRQFFESAQQYFFPQAERHYFVMTESQPSRRLPGQVTCLAPADCPAVDPSQVDCFHQILQFESRLAEFDYVYFLDVGCRFHGEPGNDLLPRDSEQLVVVRHPKYVNVPIDRLPYERNRRSRARIQPGQGRAYVTAAVFGAAADTFLAAARSMASDLEADLREGVVASQYQESYLNRYLIDHDHRLCHAGYCYPQGWDLGVPKKISLPASHLDTCCDPLSWGRGSPAESGSITVAISGDLGSQLFQYAMGRAMADRQQCSLRLDTRYFDRPGTAAYQLGLFAIRARVSAPRNLPSAGGLLSSLAWGHRGANFRMIRESGTQFDPSLLNQRGHLYLQGRWQCEAYFRHLTAALREELICLAQPIGRDGDLLARIRSAPSIAIDLMNRSPAARLAGAASGLPSPAYFQAAVRHLQSTYGMSHQLVVFTDDESLVSDYVGKESGAVVVGPHQLRPAHVLLQLMSACDHQVLAASTLAWWAAWLNVHPDKQVCVPATWPEDQTAADWQTIDWIGRTRPLSRAA